MSDWLLAETFRSTCGEVRWGSFGPPGRDPVVLLHGTPFSSYVWRGVARALARRHQLFVWDMPGYGLSESIRARTYPWLRRAGSSPNYSRTGHSRSPW